MNSLGRVAQRMVPELERYNIQVYMTTATVISPHQIVVFKRWTPGWAVRIKLKQMIKECREYENTRAA